MKEPCVFVDLNSAVNVVYEKDLIKNELGLNENLLNKLIELANLFMKYKIKKINLCLFADNTMLESDGKYFIKPLLNDKELQFNISDILKFLTVRLSEKNISVEAKINVFENIVELDGIKNIQEYIKNNSIDVNQCLIMSNDFLLLEQAKFNGFNSIRVFREGELDADDVMSFFEKAEKISQKILFHLDVDGTLLDRKLTKIHNETMLNQYLVNFFNNLVHMKIKLSDVTCKVLTSRGNSLVNKYIKLKKDFFKKAADSKLEGLNELISKYDYNLSEVYSLDKENGDFQEILNLIENVEEVGENVDKETERNITELIEIYDNLKGAYEKLEINEIYLVESVAKVFKSSTGIEVKIDQNSYTDFLKSKKRKIEVIAGNDFDGGLTVFIDDDSEEIRLARQCVFAKERNFVVIKILSEGDFSRNASNYMENFVLAFYKQYLEKAGNEYSPAILVSKSLETIVNQIEDKTEVSNIQPGCEINLSTDSLQLS